MDFEQELKKFELSSVFTINFSWLMRYVESDSGMYTPIKSISADEFREIESSFYALQAAWKAWREAKAQAVPEGFGLFDGDTLTYSNGYSINCSFDDEFDCHVFDVSKDGCYIKTGMTQLEQAHCFVLSMIKLDAKDSTLEAQEPSND